MQTDRQADRQTGQTDINLKTDRQTDRLTDIQTHRQTDRQTHRQQVSKLEANHFNQAFMFSNRQEQLEQAAAAETGIDVVVHAAPCMLRVISIHASL
jgi:hypothetical protein